MNRYSKEELLHSVKIVDLAGRFLIPLEQANSGNFTHRCKCPSSTHKSGSERTGSLYIDDNNNNYFCFGCQSSNNVVDFYMMCKDVDFSTAILELSEIVDPTKVTRVKRGNAVTNFSQQLDISSLFRKTQTEHPEDIPWIEGVMKKTDEFLIDIDRKDIRAAKSLLRKVRSTICRRYDK